MVDKIGQRFVDKKILVTGAGSGMGRAAALRMAEEGGAVWCVDINLQAAEETVEMISAEGGAAKASKIDVTDADAVNALLDEFIAEWQQIDVLCNIAGIGGMIKFEDMTPESFHKMLAVNLYGPFHFCHAAMPHLLKTKGSVINIASTAGKIGQAYLSHYVTSKHGLVGLTKALALEYGHQGVRCNVICPGAINTPMINDFSFPEGINGELIGRFNLLKWFAEPEEVAGMIAYVASDEARYINGAVLSIDGGITTG